VLIETSDEILGRVNVFLSICAMKQYMCSRINENGCEKMDWFSKLDRS